MNTALTSALSLRGNSSSRSIPVFGLDWCFFLDIDGTLVDFAERPDKVHIDAALRTILRQLTEVSGGAVALISGRQIADVDRLFSPLRLPVAGQHGMERRDSTGNVYLHHPQVERLQDAAARLEKLVVQYPELVFENKGATLALHYRRVPRLAPYADQIMRELLSGLGGEFELLAGKMVFEIKPGGRDKGTAIAEFVKEKPFQGRVPVFIGDDSTDEYGFTLVNGLRGHAIKVGTGASVARWRLVDAEAVRALLMAYIEHYLRAGISRSI